MYFVDNAGDFVVENANEGIDTVMSTAHLPADGERGDLVLQGSADLQGYGNGDANMHHRQQRATISSTAAPVPTPCSAALGNDVYFVDNAGDQVIENPGEGNDTVFSTAHFRLSANVDDLVLVGNAGLQGYGNSLRQPDLRHHRQRHPRRRGGRRRHVSAAPATTSTSSTMPATWWSRTPVKAPTRCSRQPIFRLSANWKTWCCKAVPICRATATATPTRSIGNTGNNLLNGEGGADIMLGGAGNDVYFVDDAGDMVFENANEGTDAVFATVDYTLSANVETWCCRAPTTCRAPATRRATRSSATPATTRLMAEPGPTSSSAVPATTRSCSMPGKPTATPSSTSRATAPARVTSLSFVGFGTAGCRGHVHPDRCDQPVDDPLRSRWPRRDHHARQRRDGRCE